MFWALCEAPGRRKDTVLASRKQSPGLRSLAHLCPPFLGPASLVSARLTLGLLPPRPARCPQQLSRGHLPQSPPLPCHPTLCHQCHLPAQTPPLGASAGVMESNTSPRRFKSSSRGPTHLFNLVFQSFSAHTLCHEFCPVLGLDHAIPAARYALCSLSIC